MIVTIDDAVRRLQMGSVVALPTETVYGLAASARDDIAIASIYSLKKRPSNNPLIVHVGAHEDTWRIAKSLPPHADKLMEVFWPGPLTLILPLRPEAVSPLAVASLDTVALRMPAHPLAREVARLAGPFVAPSANISGRPSATHPEHVHRDFGVDFPVLDGGSCSHGVESTILACVEGQWQIARLGALPPEAFAPVLGYIPYHHHGAVEKPLCPGQLYRHYAPKAVLHLGVQEAAMEVVVGFSDREYPYAARVIPWGTSREPSLCAQQLYHILRQLDAEEIGEAWVDMDFPREGLWITLAERLKKGAGLG